MSGPRSALAVAVLLLALSACAPSVAGAYATDAAPPNPSTTTGLPDGRVYELVSPANKHGYQAGANPESNGAVSIKFSVAAPDGDAVAFGASGPAAEINASGLSQAFVAERTPEGWKSRSTTARGLNQTEGVTLFFQQPNWLDYSPDLSHLVYATVGPQVPGAPEQSYANVYLMGSNPFGTPTWLFREASGGAVEGFGMDVLGMSPDASVIYLGYERDLLPQDTGRSGWGVYEYREGKLHEAGVLPDGSVPPQGALPAAIAGLVQLNELNHNPYTPDNPASLDNEVSEDGMRLFFIAGGELYVHEIAGDGRERSVLVSASQLPGHVGEGALHGVHLFENLTQQAQGIEKTSSAPTYAYASSDGSHVFFESEDQLTAQAPAGSAQKVYAFDVDTESLEYLPGVALGGIVTAVSDGSSFVFVNDAATPELERWTAGPAGGTVTPIVQLPGGGFVGPARMVAGNSVLVFQASAPIAGFNNADTEQIYRYNLDTDELGCLSCPPAGVKPTGDAYLSAVDQYDDPAGRSVGEDREVNDARGVAADGERVFFDSPDPLVGRDTNGQRDVYEWENGTVFLVSSGTSPEYSLFLDNSESGNDVFFTTADELVEGDNDQGFDVYDARVPRPGDNPPPAAVPCEGDVCQGPPSIAELLGSPPSATFNGVENVVDEALATAQKGSAPRRLTRAQKLAHALAACRKRKSKHRRPACERQARRRYLAVPSTVKHNSTRGTR